MRKLHLVGALLLLLLGSMVGVIVFGRDATAFSTDPAGAVVSSPPGNGTRGIVRSTRTTCSSIQDFGGDQSGRNSSDAAFERMLKSADPEHICIYLPAGTYRFDTAHSIRLPSSAKIASVTVKGDGMDVTNLRFARGSSGLEFTLNGVLHSFHIRDLSVLGGDYSDRTTGILVVQNAAVPNPAYAAPSDLSGVTVRGADGHAAKNGFGVGVSMLGNSNVNFINDYVIGTGSAVAKCIMLRGTRENISVVFNIVGTVINSCQIGLYYGSHVQGVTLSSANMTGNRTGIFTPPGASNMGQLSIAASQFANVDSDIELQTDPGGTSISSSYFLANAAATAGRARINIASAKNTVISGNVFQGIAAINGVVVQSYSPPWSLSIVGNTFSQFATAVWLQDQSQHVTVGTNSFSGNRTDVLNSGANNVGPASACAGMPSAKFSVINGVVVHC